ncbi:hypothetical protein N403_05645 [Helicobacter pylori FD430]|nr:hypothetical protein N403_05645 [Helicobacter pylori FD430]
MKWLAISFLSETAFLLVRFRIFRFKRFLAFRCTMVGFLLCVGCRRF